MSVGRQLREQVRLHAIAAGLPEEEVLEAYRAALEPARPRPVAPLEGDRVDAEAAGLVCSWCGLTWCDGHAGGDV